MGGVNGLFVLADAYKDKAVDFIVNGAFFAAGQRCTATSRIIVEEAVADDLAQRLIARIADLPMGDPRAPGTAIGPLVSLRQKEGVAAAVRAVEAEGLRPAAGGSAVDTPHAFYPPTLFLDVPRSEEHTSELQSLMRISYAVFCLKKKKKKNQSS